MRIVVSGTPGTGKTVLAKQLARQLKLPYLNLTDWVKKEKVYDTISKGEYVVDIPVFLEKMTKLLKRTPDVVIDGHLSHFIPAKHIDLCFITSCPLNVLKKRLEKRKYSARKVRDNLDCEIFDVCRIEAEENGHRPIVVWTNSEQGRTRPLPAMNSVIV